MRRCPICKKTLGGSAERRFLPFCSERCKLIDLGNWLGERYRVPDDDEEPREDELLHRGRRERRRR